MQKPSERINEIFIEKRKFNNSNNVFEDIQIAILDYLDEQTEEKKKKRRPVLGVAYYYVNSKGKVVQTNYNGTAADINRYYFGNFFYTEAEALARAEKIRNLK